METKIIGNRIANARKKMNVSQAQLAERLFISSQAVGKWERGESLPDIITLNRLAEILGVDLNYFSEGAEPVTAEVESAESTIKQVAEPSPKMQRDRVKWDMSNGNWADADFSGLKDLHRKFSSSNMQNCKFIGSDLAGLLLERNNVNTCDFSSSNISNSYIRQSYLENNVLRNCVLNETRFTESYLSDCDFTGADFTGVILQLGGFEKNILANAVWSHTVFNETYIANVVFEGAITDCYFENCAFKKVIFQNAVLTNTFFKNKSLKHIRFIDCQADRMTYEFLKNGKADLSGITLLSEVM
jgi:uncharacterized protein YjbI with pentapeptide repeats